MALFTIPERAGKQHDIQTAKKSQAVAKNTSSIKVKGGQGLLGSINQIVAMVNTHLGQYKDDYIIINDKEVLHDYITECIGNSYISIDTETDGLDPLRNTLAGICPYTYGQKGAYIPLNHISYITQSKIKDQLDMDFVMQEFKRLLDKKPDIDMFNAKFDIRFLRANGLKDIYCTWDGYLASRIMNENEPHKGLKALHEKYVLNGQGDAWGYSSLFDGIPFTYIPINTAYLYAAHDPVITTEYCDFQRKYLRPDHSRQDMRDLYWVFSNIEMPCVSVMCDMEDNGILFDNNYAQELSIKYHKLRDDALSNFYSELSEYDKIITDYKKSHPNHKLDDPINISSPSQLSTLLYDILKVDSVDPKSPRGTGVDILKKINLPIADAILSYREVDKLISTYIDKLPHCVNPKDGRIHCSFNQYGADTGRMSSSEPNLQNIPSHNKDIRKMFVASPGYVLMSSDYSQQEPRSLAALCKKHGDSQMYDTFMQGKDLYSEIASKAFNKPYEDCKEFRADGTTNKEGKARRTQAKSILLGVLYGRGEKSIGEQLGCSENKAKAIKESVFRGFPAIKKFEEESLNMAYELGYVTTVCGRKRRLPDMQLDRYEFSWKSGAPIDDDLLNFDVKDTVIDYDVPDDIIDYYTRKLDKAYFSQKQKIKQEAESEGVLIQFNDLKIADAQRQVVNSRIQGSAADLTKIAMIELSNNQRLKELGFRMLIPVHDEIIAECPIENVKECSELLSTTMSKAAEKILEMPIGCDVEITERWYGEQIEI